MAHEYLTELNREQRLAVEENARTKDEFERYKLDAGRKILEANAQAEQAKLELEKFKAARSLSHEQQSRITSKLKPFAGTVFDAAHGPKGDPEPIVFLRFLEPTLLSAGWIAIPWTGGGETYTEVGMPTIGLTAVTNVLVDVHPDWWPKYGAAATALAAALVAEGIDAKADSERASVKSDAIHIRVGRKM
jgi:hypothetical protein